MDPTAIPAWLQAGGVVAFAGAVWLELRTQRKTIERLTELVAAMRTEHARHEITTPRTTTDERLDRKVRDALERERKITPIRGVPIARVIRKKTHDGGDDGG